MPSKIHSRKMEKDLLEVECATLCGHDGKTRRMVSDGKSNVVSDLQNKTEAVGIIEELEEVKKAEVIRKDKQLDKIEMRGGDYSPDDQLTKNEGREAFGYKKEDVDPLVAFNEASNKSRFQSRLPKGKALAIYDKLRKNNTYWSTITSSDQSSEVDESPGEEEVRSELKGLQTAEYSFLISRHTNLQMDEENEQEEDLDLPMDSFYSCHSLKKSDLTPSKDLRSSGGITTSMDNHASLDNHNVSCDKHNIPCEDDMKNLLKDSGSKDHFRKESKKMIHEEEPEAHLLEQKFFTEFKTSDYRLFHYEQAQELADLDESKPGDDAESWNHDGYNPNEGKDHGKYEPEDRREYKPQQQCVKHHCMNKNDGEVRTHGEYKQNYLEYLGESSVLSSSSEYSNSESSSVLSSSAENVDENPCEDESEDSISVENVEKTSRQKQYVDETQEKLRKYETLDVSDDMEDQNMEDPEKTADQLSSDALFSTSVSLEEVEDHSIVTGTNRTPEIELDVWKARCYHLLEKYVKLYEETETIVEIVDAYRVAKDREVVSLLDMEQGIENAGSDDEKESSEVTNPFLTREKRKPSSSLTKKYLELQGKYSTLNEKYTLCMNAITVPASDGDETDRPKQFQTDRPIVEEEVGVSPVETLQANTNIPLIERSSLDTQLQSGSKNVLHQYHTDLKKKYCNVLQAYTSLRDVHVKLNDEHNELHADHDKLIDDHAALRQDHDKLTNQHQQLNADFYDLVNDHNTLKDFHMTLSDTHYKLNKTHTSLKDTHSDLKDSQLKYKAYYEEKCSYYEEKAELLNDECLHLTDKILNLTALFKEQVGNNAELQEIFEQLHGMYDALESKYNAAIKLIRDEKEKNQKASSLVENLCGKNEFLGSLNEKLQKKNASLEEKSDDLEHQNRNLHEKNNFLDSMNEKVERENENLRTEKGLLEKVYANSKKELFDLLEEKNFLTNRENDISLLETDTSLLEALRNERIEREYKLLSGNFAKLEDSYARLQKDYVWLNNEFVGLKQQHAGLKQDFKTRLVSKIQEYNRQVQEDIFEKIEEQIEVEVKLRLETDIEKKLQSRVEAEVQKRMQVQHAQIKEKLTEMRKEYEGLDLEGAEILRFIEEKQRSCELQNIDVPAAGHSNSENSEQNDSEQNSNFEQSDSENTTSDLTLDVESYRKLGGAMSETMTPEGVIPPIPSAKLTGPPNGGLNGSTRDSLIASGNGTTALNSDRTDRTNPQHPQQSVFYQSEIKPRLPTLVSEERRPTILPSEVQSKAKDFTEERRTILNQERERFGEFSRNYERSSPSSSV